MKIGYLLVQIIPQQLVNKKHVIIIVQILPLLHKQLAAVGYQIVLIILQHHANKSIVEIIPQVTLLYLVVIVKVGIILIVCYLPLEVTVNIKHVVIIL